MSIGAKVRKVILFISGGIVVGKKDDRYYMSSVKLGPKGQIVIPKEARAMFGLEPGDTLVLLADTKKGIALQTADKLNPLLRRVFQQLPGDEEAEE